MGGGKGAHQKKWSWSERKSKVPENLKNAKKKKKIPGLEKRETQYEGEAALNRNKKKGPVWCSI